MCYTIAYKTYAIDVWNTSLTLKWPWNDLKITEYGVKWQLIMIYYTEMNSVSQKML